MEYSFTKRYCTVTLKEGQDINGYFKFTGWITECDNEKLTLLLESIMHPGHQRGAITIRQEQLAMGGIAIMEIQKQLPTNYNSIHH